MHNEVVRETNLDTLPLVARGKVRDVYDVQDKLLIVSTDRLSWDHRLLSYLGNQMDQMTPQP